MAKRNLCLGILAMVLVFGISVVGCENDPTNEDKNGGVLTLTGIPLQYEGKYAQFSTVVNVNSTEIIYGINYNQSAGTQSFCRISNGKVDFPMWIQTLGENEISIKKYTGNNTVEGVVMVFETASFGLSTVPIIVNWFGSIIFSNGNVTISWNDGIEEDW